MMKNQCKYLVLVAVTILVIAILACGSSTTKPEDTPASAPTTTPKTADTPSPTGTPRPTDTPRPTSTPRSTNTPRPTPTPTPQPEPIILSGSGDDVVELDKWDGAALAHISYSGGSNFVVWNYGPDGERMDLLVNTIGRYEGTRPLDFLDGEQTTRFQVESSGEWEIEVLPLLETRKVTVPGTFEGAGDDVVFLSEETPDLLKIDATTAQSNFVIWGYGDTRELLVNEIAPYDGVVIAGANTLVLVIEAEGNWSIEVTAR